MLKRLLYEPLLHFLILGGLLFVLYAFVQKNEEDEKYVHISQERITQLFQQSEKKLLSILTEEEKEKLIQKEVYEQVLYKEALKVGLNKNDADMRGHLAKKMEFLIYDTTDFPISNDETLKTFMLKNSKDYSKEEKITFSQNLLGLSMLNFEEEYTLDAFEATNVFGRSFSEELFILEADDKVYKIESDYGIHEIKIISKPTPELQAFEEVKEQVKNDYLNTQRLEKNTAIYEKIKAQYSISVEMK